MTEEQVLLRTASQALRSYQYGNDSSDLAKEIADEIEKYLEAVAARDRGPDR